MISSTVLINDPLLAHLTSEVDKILKGIDFKITIESELFGIDPIIPRYRVHIPDLNMTIGDYTTAADLLSAMVSWFKVNPVEYEDEMPETKVELDELIQEADKLRGANKATQRYRSEIGLWPKTTPVSQPELFTQSAMETKATLTPLNEGDL